MPTATKSLIELDQGDEFVALCLRQSQLRRKRVGVVCQYLQVIGSPGLEANLGQSRRVLRRFEQVLLLSRELLILAISNQRIRHIAECALDRLLIG